MQATGGRFSPSASEVWDQELKWVQSQLASTGARTVRLTLPGTGGRRFLGRVTDKNTVRYIDEEQQRWEGFDSSSPAWIAKTDSGGIARFPVNLDQALIDQEYRYVWQAERVQEKILKQNRLAAQQCHPDNHKKQMFAERVSELKQGNQPDTTPAPCSIGAEPLGPAGAAYTIGIKNQDGWCSGNIIHGEEILPYTMVFDGHGYQEEHSEQCACVIHLQQVLSSRIAKKLHQYGDAELTDTVIWNSLKTGFVEANFSFASQRLKNYTGSTANVVLYYKDKIWCANAGDSGAMLLKKNGSFQSISYDARADDPALLSSMSKRSPNAHPVIRGRLCGSLQPARGFGDHQYGLRCSARPKITCIDKPEEGWNGCHVIQATDGVWDHASRKSVAELAYKHFQGGLDCTAVAGHIVSEVATLDRSDDITVLVTPVSHIL